MWIKSLKKINSLLFTHGTFQYWNGKQKSCWDQAWSDSIVQGGKNESFTVKLVGQSKSFYKDNISSTENISNKVNKEPSEVKLK